MFGYMFDERAFLKLMANKLDCGNIRRCHGILYKRLASGAVSTLDLEYLHNGTMPAGWAASPAVNEAFVKAHLKKITQHAEMLSLFYLWLIFQR